MKASYGAVDPSRERPLATARLEFRDRDLELRWAHCSQTADFMAELFGGLARKAGLDAHEATHSISYLTNELLENAVKFRAPGDVLLEASLVDGVFGLWLSNLVTEETGLGFQALLAEIVAGDPGELLIARIEANAEDESGTGSGLGILTLMNDYGVAMSWSFEPAEDGLVRLETLATVALS
jgi:hypothetical protein